MIGSFVQEIVQDSVIEIQVNVVQNPGAYTGGHTWVRIYGGQGVRATYTVGRGSEPNLERNRVSHTLL